MQLRRRRIRRGLPHRANNSANPSPVGLAHYAGPDCQPKPNANNTRAHAAAVHIAGHVKPDQHADVHGNADGVAVKAAVVVAIRNAVDIAVKTRV